MVDAVSFSANALGGLALAGPRATADARPAAPAPEVMEAALPAESAEPIGDLDFLYGTNGRPAGTRLSVNSGALDALFASLMTPPPARTAEAAPQDGGGSFIAKLYEQF